MSQKTLAVWDKNQWLCPQSLNSYWKKFSENLKRLNSGYCLGSSFATVMSQKPQQEIKQAKEKFTPQTHNIKKKHKKESQ